MDLPLELGMGEGPCSALQTQIKPPWCDSGGPCLLYILLTLTEVRPNCYRPQSELADRHPNPRLTSSGSVLFSFLTLSIRLCFTKTDNA